MEALRNKKLYLLDMDGTIYMGNTLFPGTLPLLQYINDIQGEYVFITNNSSKSVSDYVKKLAQMGIPAAPENFYTSSQATAAYLLEQYPGQKAYCMGTRSLIAELEAQGITVVTDIQENPDLIVMGYDTELTYKKLWDVSELLFKGLPYIATNEDRSCPTEFGFVPDCGGFSEMLFMATGRRPHFIGKPKPTMVEYVMQSTGFSPEETLVVGDRLYTDIAAGNNAGVDTLCVLSGETTPEELAESDIKPTWVLQDLSALMEFLGK